MAIRKKKEVREWTNFLKIYVQRAQLKKAFFSIDRRIRKERFVKNSIELYHNEKKCANRLEEYT